MAATQPCGSGPGCRPLDFRHRLLAAARRRFDEAALLATCERVELYALRSARHPHAAIPGCEVLRGPEAVRHLLRVAAGLESRMVGEPQILDQVAAAAREALRCGSGGPFLSSLFDAAQRAGQRARAETPLGRMAGSHAQATARRVREHLEALHATRSNRTSRETPPRCDVAPEGDRTAIVGILGGGAMAMEIADALGSARVRLFARHVERAREAAGHRDVEVVPLAALPECAGELAALVAATTSPRTLVGPRDLAGSVGSLLVVDLGVPPNIDATVTERPGVTLVALTDLASPLPDTAIVAAAEVIVEQELAAAVRHLAPIEVLLAAHGAGDGSDANAIVHHVGDRVAGRRPGARVSVAFNLGTPRLAPALPSPESAPSPPSRVVVPVMTSEGWFASQRLPEMLGLVSNPEAHSTGHATVVTQPVGSVRRLVRAAIDEACRAVEAAAIASHRVGITLIVVGHGTTRRASSGDATRALATEIHGQLEGREGVEVVAAFLDEPPLLESVADSTRSTTRIVLPWLIGGGDHALRDLRERTIRDGDPHPTVLLEPLGRREELVNAILDLVDWYAPGRVLRLGTRGSTLARRQAALATERLSAAGVATEIRILDTEGDRDHSRPIDDFPTDGPFSDALERALFEGTIDVAVHSLKDLPLEGAVDTCIAAVLPRGDAGEALVTRDGRRLAELSAGARVGTCSVRRALQLAALRPDLDAVPMRGAVDRRVAAVDGGEFDAAILAVAGLDRLGLSHRIAQRFCLKEILCEAGQGAIALTARVDDRPARQACGAADHRATRVAVEVERRIAAAIEQEAIGVDEPVAAVHARLDAEGLLHVLARVIDRRTGAMRDAAIVAGDATAAVARTLGALARQEVPA